jgi:hypothetical protein
MSSKSFEAEKRLAEKVIGQLRHLFKAYVYGGYVRDLIAEEPFTDVDIYLPKSVSENSVLKAFEDMQLICAVDGRFPSITHSDLTQIKTSVTDKSGTTIAVDLVKSSTIDSPFRPQMDASVNHLYLAFGINANANYAPYASGIITQIKNKVFTVETYGIPQGNIYKLLTKGYSQVDSSGKVIKESLAFKRPIVGQGKRYKCEACNDTGIRDFEFYTRNCECRL